MSTYAFEHSPRPIDQGRGRDQMAHPNEALVREQFAAFERGDMDVLRKQYWTDDIRWHVPGRSPFAGDYEGVEQVIQGFRSAFRADGRHAQR